MSVLKLMAGLGGAPSPINFGSEVVFDSLDSRFTSICYDTTNNKVVISYQNTASSNTVAVVGTISGASITFGTPVVVEGSSNPKGNVFDPTSGKVIVFYQDQGSGLTAIVGTVSGTSISFGSPAVVSSKYSDTAACYDSVNNKVVVAYRDNASPYYGFSKVGTVSGTSISFGAEATYAAGSSRVHQDSIAYDSTNGKVVIVFRDVSNSSYPTAVVGTVSGTSISFGTEVVIDNSNNAGQCATTYDVASGKIVMAYPSNTSPYPLLSAVGTVSGTSISFGTPVVVDSALFSTSLSFIYDSINEQVVLSYSKSGQFGRAIVGVVAGTSISYSDTVDFSVDTSSFGNSTYDPDTGSVIISYQDVGNSNYGTAIVGEL
jgi:hypothetical protein